MAAWISESFRCWTQRRPLFGRAVGPLGCASLVVVVCAASGAEPATVAEAARVLDLRTLEVIEGADFPGGRSVAQLTYEGTGDVRKVYAFHEQSLVKAGWTVLPNGYVSDQMASGTFAKDGFKVSLSVMPSGQSQTVRVSIANHGNVDTEKLPVPDGSSPFFGGPVSTAYVAPGPVSDVATSLREKLLAESWQPYGSAGDVAFFKRNAVLLKVRVTSAPAQGGKTVVDYSTEQMSADLPAPPDASRIQYAEVTRELSFDAPTLPDAVEAFYRQTLTASGWKATTERAVESRFESSVLFRNGEKDLLMLTLRKVDNATRGRLRFMTAEEVAELEERAKTPSMAEADEPESTATKIVFPIPATARGLETSPDSIEFTLPSGTGRTAVEQIRKHFKDAGWKEELVSLEKIAGSVMLIKDTCILTITFADIGLEGAEVTAGCLGGILTPAKSTQKK